MYSLARGLVIEVNFRALQSGWSKRHDGKDNINASNNQSARVSISDPVARQVKPLLSLSYCKVYQAPPHIEANLYRCTAQSNTPQKRHLRYAPRSK